MVGTTRETVARALGQLAKAGIARRRGRELLIRDLPLLEALSEAEALSRGAAQNVRVTLRRPGGRSGSRPRRRASASARG